MNKKFLAIAMTALMILGLLPALLPTVSAQVVVPSNNCTIADLTHGAGTIEASTSPFCVFMHPGANDTFRHAWSHTLGTLYGDAVAPVHAAVGGGITLIPGTPETNPQTKQVFDHYLDYAMLTSTPAGGSIGDLQFDLQIPLNITVAGAPAALMYNVTLVDIFVPPEFTWTAPTRNEAVWTDITNDYQYISVGTQSAYSTIAPNWVRVRIGSDAEFGGRLHMNSGLYHVRLFGLRAPEIAGLYHIKIYARIVITPGTGGLPGFAGYQSIGVLNYPVTVVKGELNPAWVEVDVRTHLHVAAPFVSGVVDAVGTTPDGRAVEGKGYWSVVDWYANSLTPGAVGGLYRLYLFGLPAGTYTVTATASGFNPTVTDRFTVLAGQSYHIQLVLFGSPIVDVTLWSKHGTGAIPWHNLWQRPYGTNNPTLAPVDGLLNGSPEVLAEIGFATPAVRDVLLNLYDKAGNMIGWWASDTIHGATLAVPWATGPGFGGNQKDLAVPNMLLGAHDDANIIPAYGTVGGAIPTHTNYWARLVDNCDPTWAWATGAWLPGNARQLPSTQWDGHVPWTWADYVAGMPQGQYTVEGYVTGYIMDEADAYQRTFTVVGTNVHPQFDLRRTNWIESTIHMPTNAGWTGPFTTLVLTASDANNQERGAASFWVTPAMVILDQVINGADATIPLIPAYGGGIIIEGWNAVYPNLQTRNAQFADYGLNPTASTVRLDKVEPAGNDYSITLYMADMGIPARRINGTGWYNIVDAAGQPYVPKTSVFLCNSPAPLSFNVVNASLWISLRSTDFEIPAHDRPWTFPGSEIWVDFKDESGASVANLDPTLYGLIQDPGMLNATMPHYGWDVPGRNPACPAVGVGTICTNGGWGVSPFDVDIINTAGAHSHIGVHFYGNDPSAPWSFEYANIFELGLTGGLRPTHLPAGQYSYKAYTHSYVQRRSYPVMIPLNGWADIEADLIQGGMIRTIIAFRHEGAAINFTGSVRVEVFNSQNQLVGASIYGQAHPNWFTLEHVSPTGAYPGYVGPWAGAANLDWMNWGVALAAGGLGQHAGPAQAADFGAPIAPVPAAATPYAYAQNALYPSSTNGVSNGQRAFVSSYNYPSTPLTFLSTHRIPNPFGVPNTWANWPARRATGFQTAGRYWSPAEANRLVMPAGSAAAFDIYGFYYYFGDQARTWAGGYPTTNGAQMSASWIDSANGGNYMIGTDQWDYGLPGSVDIPGWAGSGGGLYTVKVWAFDPMGPDNHFERTGFSDDWQMYSMGWTLENVQVPWGGSQQLFVDMNAMATLRGTVRWFDMYGDLRPLPWAQISATNPDTVAYATGYGSAGTGTSDSAGGYIMWLQAGTHDVSVSTSEASGVWSSAAPTSNSAFTVVVSDGWVGGADTQLSGSGTPVPEVPAYMVPIGLFAALAASVWLLRKRSLNIPVMMK